MIAAITLEINDTCKTAIKMLTLQKNKSHFMSNSITFKNVIHFLSQLCFTNRQLRRRRKHKLSIDKAVSL